MTQGMNADIKIKENLNFDDYKDIGELKKICAQYDQTSLKLELDFKLNRSGNKSDRPDERNEFLYYSDHRLVGYIGICSFGGNGIEVNGMVHPDYRRQGIFTELFSFVKDEWAARAYPKMLLLSDYNSVSGLGFIKHTGAVHDHSEYEMYLNYNSKQEAKANHVVLRKATNADAKEIARQNFIYFEEEFEQEEDQQEEAIPMPEEEEKYGSLILLAEAEGKIIGKVHLEKIEKTGGIYGLGVLPEHRRKGYGREILLLSINILLEKDSENIMLQVATKNKSALNIYKSCGFEETSTMDYYEIAYPLIGN